jgi:hypothetical protein
MALLSRFNRKNLAIAAGVMLVAGVSLAAAVGTATWIRNAESGSVAAPASVVDANRPGLTNNSSSAAPAGPSDGYYPIVQPPVYIRQPQSAPQQPVASRNADDAYVQRATYRSRGGRRRGRSKRHSVEIVAGTALAGAAIGAIAGGGPGAAIGAISGAGAGFVYDRATHNH